MRISIAAKIMLAVSLALPGATVFAQPQQASGAGAAASSVMPTDRASDRMLRKRVKEALKKTKGLTSVAIAVRAKGGKVTLQGTVPNDNQVQLAGNVARSVPGVVSVDNTITANRPTNSWH